MMFKKLAIQGLLIASACAFGLHNSKAHARGGNAGAAIAGGIIGLAAGAIIGSAIANQTQPTYYPRPYPRPVPPAQNLMQRAKRISFSRPVGATVTLGSPRTRQVSVTTEGSFTNGRNLCMTYRSWVVRHFQVFQPTTGSMCMNSRGDIYEFGR